MEEPWQVWLAQHKVSSALSRTVPGRDVAEALAPCWKRCDSGLAAWQGMRKCDRQFPAHLIKLSLCALPFPPSPSLNQLPKWIIDLAGQTSIRIKLRSFPERFDSYSNYKNSFNSTDVEKREALLVTDRPKA